MTFRPWCWLLALSLVACTGTESEDGEGPDGPGAKCTTELRPNFDGEGCCGEPVGEPLCSTGTIVFCEVRDARSEPISCYYKHNNTKLRCSSCQNTNDCVAAAERACG
ncbi:hypothetical protein [Pyxidicoccus xibeiensis]|uniref:hypothetical protein n=1 Tax=Pyxidicoccus xibeiensis TaxID=2906759 RepID=UPI0020A78BD1|nr:hypothetical protein [Pyxidicoccus xibeiensis]MCP3143242.1 hypothetical protein [Pyxidicoccus xibeiensis]